MMKNTLKQRKAKSLLWGLGGLFLFLPTLLVAQNGVTISELSVGTGSVTFNISWNKPDASFTKWSDSVWVFVDYNEGSKMKRLPLLTAGATLTNHTPGVGKVEVAPNNNDKGVWVVGNARTLSSFSATVVLPFNAATDLKGACAYASNYPPFGDWNSEGTQVTLTGTAPYVLHLEGLTEKDLVIYDNVYTLSSGYTLASFTDATGAPGMTSEGSGTQTWTCGTQIWSGPVKKNIEGISATTDLGSDNPPATCMYRSADIVSGSGYLYNWICVQNNATTKLCESPWEVPTMTDFINLDLYLGGSGDDQFGANGDDRYNGTAWGGVAGGGAMGENFVGSIGAFWSSNEIDNNVGRALLYAQDYVTFDDNSCAKRIGMQVRCIKKQ
jgi:uncharacterized protein (TIGR02145 family)